jgi:hypothetical protein
VLKKRKDTPPLYCVPDGFGLTGEQILEMLRKEVKENPSSADEIAPELTGHGLPLGKCEAYNRVYDQPYESN